MLIFQKEMSFASGQIHTSPSQRIVYVFAITSGLTPEGMESKTVAI